MNKPIDAHAHFLKSINNCTENELYNQINENLKELMYIVNVAIDIETSIETINLNKKFKNLLPTVGIHPNESNVYNEEKIKTLEKLINDNVVAIGEIGLDFYREYNKENQILNFNAQIELAKKYSMPIIIHCRDAFEDLSEIIIKHKDVKFLLHSWSGSEDLTKKLLLFNNIYFSFTGILTFKNGENMRNLLKLIPKEKVMFETDSPYLSPEPLRGKVNQPKNVKYIIEKAAEIYNIAYERLVEISNDTFFDFFNVIKNES